MAGSIKGITVEIGGDTTGLSKALGGINKEISSTQKQLKEVERLLKLDPKNTELLAQKQRLLSEAITETSTKLDALKQAEAKAQEQFKKGELSRQEYEKLQRQIIATEQKLQSLASQASKSKKMLESISSAAGGVSDKLGKLGDKLAPVTAGVLGLGTAALSTVDSTEELRSDLSKLDQNAKEHKVSIDTARKAWEDFVTDITPTAPHAIIGNVSASSPLMTSKSSGLFLIISSTCSRLPLASFTATMLSQSRARRTVVSAFRFTPVRPGTLYNTTGNFAGKMRLDKLLCRSRKFADCDRTVVARECGGGEITIRAVPARIIMSFFIIVSILGLTCVHSAKLRPKAEMKLK